MLCSSAMIGWFLTAVIGPFREWLFHLVVPPAAVWCCMALLLLCFLNSSVHASGISVPLSQLMLFGWSLTLALYELKRGRSRVKHALSVFFICRIYLVKQWELIKSFAGNWVFIILLWHERFFQLFWNTWTFTKRYSHVALVLCRVSR